MLRWAVLGGLVLALAGCGLGKKDKTNASRSGLRNDPSSPTYPWKRPPDDLPPQAPPTKPGKLDPF